MSVVGFSLSRMGPLARFILPCTACGVKSPTAAAMINMSAFFIFFSIALSISGAVSILIILVCAGPGRDVGPFIRITLAPISLAAFASA